MTRRRHFLSTLTDICLLDEWQLEAMAQRLRHSLQAQVPWLKPLTKRILRRFPEPPSHAALLAFLADDELMGRIGNWALPRIRIYPLQKPAARALHPSVPELHAVGDLANWLHLAPTDLDWFADRAGRAASSKVEKIRHYHVSTLAKRHGGVRLLEIPKSTLKHIQRRIHEEMLVHLPLHGAAHGFLRNDSVLRHAEQHVGQEVVLRFDLRDCFLHVSGRAIFRAFFSLGYCASVSRYLLGLCSHRLPRSALKQLPLEAGQQERAEQLHLPQGAPSSPLLSHFALRNLDARLSGYALRLGASYSRYADDLVLSGGSYLAQQFRQIEQRVGAIALDEGFALNFRKSRCQHDSQRQQVTGVTVNQRLNIPRREFDALKAELHNCVRFGWRSQQPSMTQDYRSHLRGRIGWCRQLNPARAHKLQSLFDAIAWDQS